MASVKKCKHCGEVLSDEDEALGYDGVCSKCVFDIIWDLNKQTKVTMDEKRVCKVCKEEKSVASFGLGEADVCLRCKTALRARGWYVSKDDNTISAKGYNADVQFIPSPRMTIATAAMQGLLSEGWGSNSAEFVAQKAVDFADALLNKLSEPKDGVQR